jgi:prepilin-type processing-associated H-X9-DG protein
MHSSYRGITGIADRGGYFDNNQWQGPPLPATYRGLLHSVGTGNMTYESMASVIDGTSNTLAVGEYITTTHTSRGTFWGYSYTCYSLGSIGLESRLYLPDYDLCRSIPGVDGENACKRGLGSLHPGGINFTLADGSVRLIPTTADVQVLAALATIQRGESVQLP